MRESGGFFFKRKITCSENWFSGKWLYYSHFSLKSNLLTSWSTIMWVEGGDLHVLQYALGRQKVGGETVASRFSQSLLQAVCAAVGRWNTWLSCWAVWLHAEQLQLPLHPQWDDLCTQKTAGTKTLQIAGLWERSALSEGWSTDIFMPKE